MPHSPGPDRDDRSDDTSKTARFDPDAATGTADSDADPTDEATQINQVAPSDSEPVTEVMAKAPQDSAPEATKPQLHRGERRFTAPGFDAKETTVMEAATEPATEVFRARQEPSGPGRIPRKIAIPQLIPPRLGERLRPSNQRSWGWVLALILIILALAAIAVLGTVLLTHGNKRKAASQADEVRSAIQNFDIAVQNGDLAALRSMTCGNIRDGYINYDEQAWAETYRRVAAAKQYPVVASIDQIVVNDGHAEANVTAFMAYAPQVRSTRSFDLQYRDHQWKICQSTG
jgi:flagellar basal body-associated protein FliL